MASFFIFFFFPVLLMDFNFELQVEEPKFVFEAKTIQRMELLVLSRLKWKMQAITPFSFIDYFLSKITVEQHIPSLFFSKSSQLILSTIKGVLKLFLSIY